MTVTSRTETSAGDEDAQTARAVPGAHVHYAWQARDCQGLTGLWCSRDVEARHLSEVQSKRRVCMGHRSDTRIVT